MIIQTLELKISESVRVLVLSDIHLMLPATPELDLIEKSLVARIVDLSKSKDAILVLNGDIFELWEQTDQTIADIIAGFEALDVAIKNFSGGRGHRLLYCVGNHDELLATSANDRAVLLKQWGAEIASSIELRQGRRLIRIEHGHEHDHYNKTSPTGVSYGKRLVQHTLPMLQLYAPTLFKGIGDVVGRELLPSYVLSNLVYGLVVPLLVPLVLGLSMAAALYERDPRYLFSALAVLVAAWLATLLFDRVLRLLAARVFGGGARFMDSIFEYQKRNRYDVLILGHTHRGAVVKRGKYYYANSGCNDIIAIPKNGWLGLVKFNRFVQMSDIRLNNKQKEFVKYHEDIITLLK